MNKKILVSENLQGPALDELCDKFNVVCEPDLWKDQQALLEAILDYNALIVRNQTQVNTELIAAAENLEIVGRAGIGLDNIDVPAAKEAGIKVVFAPEQNAISVAELTLGLMLSLARSIPRMNAEVHAGIWERQGNTGMELFGKTLGLVGLGKIGFRVALRANAFGMNVLVYDPWLSPDSLTVSESKARLVSLEDLLQHSDFVSCHIPLTEATRHLMDQDKLRLMKPTAYLINTSRGGIINEAALLQALKENTIAGAALDVRETEPPENDPLRNIDNVILTPHVAAFSREAQERVLQCVCKDVAAVLNGQRAIYSAY